MDTNVNRVYVRGVYGSAGGPTLGNMHSPMTPFEPDDMTGQAGNTSTTDGGGSSATVAKSGSAGGPIFGQPLSWLVVLIVLLFGLKFVAEKWGGGEDFKSVRVSVHNVVIISLAAIIGIGFFKVVFNRWKVPGLTTYINAV